jgi:hypothetical protein
MERVEDHCCAQFIASKYSGDEAAGVMPEEVEDEISRLVHFIEGSVRSGTRTLFL